jgi:predicted nucleic acid-binding protein
MAQMVRQQEQAEIRYASNTNSNRDSRVTIKDFLAMSPRVFSSSAKLLDADDWLAEMNEALSVAGVAQEDRVPFATFLLRGESAVWWKTRQALLAPGIVVSWEHF